MTSKQFWIWILANGIAAVFLATTPLFFVSESKALNAVLPFGVGAEFIQTVGLILVPMFSVLLPGLVLRKLNPQVPLAIWFFGVIGYCALTAGFLYNRVDVATGWGSFGSQFFELIHLHDRSWWQLLSLPWHRAFFTYFILPLLCWVPLIVALRFWHKQWRFAVYVGLAMATATLVQYLTTLYLENIAGLPDRNALGGKAIEGLAFRDAPLFAKHFIAGSFAGAAAALVLVPALVTSAPIQRIKLKAISVVLTTCISIPLYGYLVGHHGFSAGFPEIKKVFTTAPISDSIVGAPILKLVSETKFLTPNFPNAPAFGFARFEPQKRHFVTLDENRALVSVDPANGEVLKKIADPIFNAEDFSFAWTRDGKFFLLRSGVKLDNDPFTVEGRKKSRIRIFTMPDYNLLGDNIAPMRCPVTGLLEQPIELKSERSFMLYCNPSGVVTPDMPEMIKVPVEAKEPIVTVKLLNTPAVGRRFKLMESWDDAYVVWQGRSNGVTAIWLQSVNSNSAPQKLKNLESRDVAGGLTLQDITFSNGFFHVRFCGMPRDISNPPSDAVADKIHGVCRGLYYDPNSFELVRKENENPIKYFEKGWRNSTYDSDTFSFTTRWQISNRTGQIEVMNRTNKEALQTITSRSQSIVTVSNDETYFVTHAFDDRRLIIYKIDHAAQPPAASSN